MRNPRYDQAKRLSWLLIRCFHLAAAFIPIVIAAAICEAGDGIESSPGDKFRARVDRADPFVSLGKIDQAIAEIRTAIRLKPNEIAPRLDLIRALRDKGSYDEAIAESRGVIASFPNSSTAYVLLGDLFVERGKYDDASTAYRTAIRLAPESSVPHHMLGKMLARRVRHGEAIVELRRADRLKPDDAAILEDLATALASSGRNEEAIDVFEQVDRLNSNSAAPREALAAALSAEGLFDDAIAEYREAIRLGSNPSSINKKIDKCLEDKKRLVYWVARRRDDVRKKPEDAYSHYKLGLELKSLCNFEEATARLRAAVEEKSDFGEARVEYGRMLEMKGEYPAALAEYRRAIQFNRRYIAEAHYALGLLFDKTGSYAEAIVELKRAHSLNFGLSSWKHSSDYAIETCAARAALEKRLPAILAGTDRLADASETLDAARICAAQTRYVSAGRYFDAAFAADPDYAIDLSTDLLHTAALAHLLASLGSGIEPADVSTRIRARSRAIELIQQELDICESEKHLNHYSVRAALYRLLTDDVLTGFRREVALVGFPRAERAAWGAIWKWIDDLNRDEVSKAP